MHMFILVCNDQHITLDEAGFLVDLNDWNEEVAVALASKEGIDSLSAEQLDIIRLMRASFLKHQVFPVINDICRSAHQPKECVTEQFMDTERAWKIAGLPKQDGGHFVTLDGKHDSMEPCR